MQNNLETYIARHGVTEWNKVGRIQGQSNNVPLSEEGIKQMQSLGQYLSSLRKQFLVVLSPMLRAQQSFLELNKILMIPESDVYTLEEMKEMDFGEFEGLLKPDTKSHSFYADRAHDKWGTQYPNGESYADIYNRLSQSQLLEISEKAKAEEKAILTIGHESINRVIPQLLYLGMEENQFAAENRQKNNEIVIISNGTRLKISF